MIRKMLIAAALVLLLAFGLATGPASAQTWSCSTTNPNQACPVSTSPPDYVDTQSPGNLGIFGSNGYTTYVEGQWWGGGGRYPTLLQSGAPGPHHPLQIQEKTSEPGTNGATQGDPGVFQVLTDASGVAPLITNFSYLWMHYTVTYTDSDLAGLSDETAADVFIKDPGHDIGEVMVWVDTWDVQSGCPLVHTAVIFDRRYAVQYCKGASAIVLELLGGNGKPVRAAHVSGVVHLVATMGWLREHGYISAKAGFSMPDFINEPRGTADHAFTWTLSSYAMPGKCKVAEDSC